MSRPQLVLKQSTGWFAAGWQFGQALGELSDAAFKLYAWLCLNADRHTGQLQSTVPEFASALKKPESWTEAALRELVERGVCWMEADVLEIADQYWPYQRQARGLNRRTTSVRFGACCSRLPASDPVSRWPMSAWRRISISAGSRWNNCNEPSGWAVPANTSRCSTASHPCRSPACATSPV